MQRFDRRLLFVAAILAAWAVIVVIRLAHVQLVRHDHYVARAQRQQESTIELAPVRGSIVDAKGRTLAESVAAESIYADPQDVADHRAAAKAIAAVPGVGVSAREIENRLRTGRGFAWIARQLPLDITANVRRLKLAGIYFLEEHRRSYPRTTLAASVIGYVGLDGEGLSGLEHSFDRHVRGTPGKVTVLRDARRGMYLVGGEGANRPRDGHEVVLTIDAVAQFIAERALARAVEKHNAKGGSVLVMDPRDGAILAMASLPTFDPNRYRQFGPAAWRNRNVQDLYEPGSTFKIVTAAAGLEEGIVTPSQIVDCGDGAIRIANVTISEHDDHRYGLMSFSDVIAHSSNVGTVRVALQLGPRRLHDWARRFGFGARTGIELPGESPGLLRRVEKWSAVSNASVSIGQEIGVTPLQIARAVSAVANGGRRVDPHIIARVVDADGSPILLPPPQEPVRVMSEKTAAVLNEILKATVALGTGGNAALVEHVVAGKTGTAQKAGRGGYMPGKYVGSFVGYVPADKPRLVILVALDEPRPEHYGGAVAAPVFREVAEATLRYLGVPPSLPARTIGLDQVRLATFSQNRRPAAAAGVPDLIGLDARAAIARAVASGLTVRASGSGVITSQDPLPGSPLPADRQVRIDLAARPRPRPEDGPEQAGSQVPAAAYASQVVP